MSIHDLSVLGNALMFAVLVTCGGLIARALTRAMWLRPSRRRAIRVGLSVGAIVAVAMAGGAMWPAALDDDAPVAQGIDGTGSPRSTDDSSPPVVESPVPSSRDEGGAGRSHEQATAADGGLGASIPGANDGPDALDTGPSTDPGAGPGTEPTDPPSEPPVSDDPPVQGDDPPGGEPSEDPPVQGDDPPGHGDDPPGHGDDPPGHGDDPPGHGDDPPGHGDDPPGPKDDPPADEDEPPGQDDDHSS
jgi:hypothetical protein